jgi:tetratricopeptide (TPR) repeat protein
MEPILFIAGGLLMFMLSLNAWERIEARRSQDKPKRKNQPQENTSAAVQRVLLIERWSECMARRAWSQALDHALAGSGVLPVNVMHGLVAETYLAQHDPASAMRHLTIVLNETPSDPLCRALLGLCHAQNAETEQALECLQVVSGSAATARLALRHQATALLLCHKPDNAVQLADPAIRVYRHSTAGEHERHYALGLLLLLRGQACFFSGRDDDALRDLHQARLYPHTGEAALLSLIAIHYSANNLETAHSLFSTLPARIAVAEAIPELPGMLRSLADRACRHFSRDDFVPSVRRL